MNKTRAPVNDTIERRVLIVDDDPDFGGALADALEPHGYRVDVARTEAEARAQVAELEPRVALLDVRLGHVHGIELISALRAIRPQLVCVIVTAYAEVDTVVEALQEGAYDYLRKPVDTPSLLAVLERAFEKIKLESERAAAQEALRERDQQIRLLLDSTAEGICGLDRECHCQFLNQAARNMLGYARDEDALGRHLHELVHHADGDGAATDPADCDVCRSVARGERIHRSDAPLGRADGTTFHAQYWVHPIVDGEVTGAVLTFLDISEQKRNAEEHTKLEAQFRQAQKMEAVGQLAGGVAHDFNNLLTAILGNVELLRAAVTSEQPNTPRMLDELEQIERAGQRAGSLTRQLLAFSRRQILKAEVLDLNAVLDEMDKMLRRLIGEDVTLTLSLGAGIGRVQADAGQIEQAIMNLVINARDAMPDGGQLTIETSSATFDDEYVATHPGARTGPHVVIAVSDTGRGMDRRTLDRIFEPFFTTKPVGKGTGLGLSTTYGIVRQVGGHVTVYSEPGRGTTFRLCLPSLPTRPEVTKTRDMDVEPVGGTETILLCEDEEVVRSLATRVLERAGYRVLSASTGSRAEELCKTHAGPIDLLLTDVILPDRNGKKVAESVRAQHHAAHVLFMSGYTADVIAKHGVLEEGIEFLDKPFSVRTLLQRVREVLDR